MVQPWYMAQKGLKVMSKGSLSFCPNQPKSTSTRLESHGALGKHIEYKTEDDISGNAEDSYEAMAVWGHAVLRVLASATWSASCFCFYFCWVLKAFHFSLQSYFNNIGLLHPPTRTERLIDFRWIVPGMQWTPLTEKYFAWLAIGPIGLESYPSTRPFN